MVIWCRVVEKMTECRQYRDVGWPPEDALNEKTDGLGTTQPYKYP